MARNKNSPALFEVIRNAQQKQKEQAERQRQQQIAAELNATSPAAALLRSPMYWFKGKQAHEASADRPAEQAAVAAPPAVARKPKAVKAMEPVLPVMREVAAPVAAVPVIAAPAIAAPLPVEEQVDESSEAVVRAEPVPIEQPVTADSLTAKPPAAASGFVAPPPAPSTAFFSVFGSPAAEAARQVREELAAQEAPAAEPMFAGAAYHQPFDNADDEESPAPPFSLQFNHTTAIVAGFAIVVAFAVAYIIGTAGRADKTIAKFPTRPDVLNVGRNNDPSKPDAGKAVAPPAPLPVDDGDRASLANSGDLSLDTLGKPIAVPTNVKRVVNYQYVVLMSFANEAPAKEMVKFLAQNGVAATAEKALPGYSRSWTSVVTARGFEKTRDNPAFDQYAAVLSELKQKYSPKSKFNKTFAVDVYTWGKAR